MLFIEYDVTAEGRIELVALINAVEENDEDPAGEAWLGWRRAQGDDGFGCAPVPPEDLVLMEATETPDQLESLVERVVLADRRQKESAVT